MPRFLRISTVVDAIVAVVTTAVSDVVIVAARCDRLLLRICKGN